MGGRCGLPPKYSPPGISDCTPVQMWLVKWVTSDEGRRGRRLPFLTRQTPGEPTQMPRAGPQLPFYKPIFCGFPALPIWGEITPSSSHASTGHLPSPSSQAGLPSCPKHTSVIFQTNTRSSIFLLRLFLQQADGGLECPLTMMVFDRPGRCMWASPFPTQDMAPLYLRSS